MQPLCWWQLDQMLVVVKPSPVGGGILEAYRDPVATPKPKTDEWLSHSWWEAHFFILICIVNLFLVRVTCVVRGCYAPVMYLVLN